MGNVSSAVVLCLVRLFAGGWRPAGFPAGGTPHAARRGGAGMRRQCRADLGQFAADLPRAMEETDGRNAAGGVSAGGDLPFALHDQRNARGGAGERGVLSLFAHTARAAAFAGAAHRIGLRAGPGVAGQGVGGGFPARDFRGAGGKVDSGTPDYPGLLGAKRGRDGPFPGAGGRLALCGGVAGFWKSAGWQLGRARDGWLVAAAGLSHPRVLLLFWPRVHPCSAGFTVFGIASTQHYGETAWRAGGWRRPVFPRGIGP